jgi:hypothetical protein
MIEWGFKGDGLFFTVFWEVVVHLFAHFLIVNVFNEEWLI